MGVYTGREIAMATRHGKERSFAPSFRAMLGARLVVPHDLDTDVLGTFSGEVERTADVIETARRKAAMGMRATGLPLGLSTEGSFGPDPMVPFIAVHHELAMFVDQERGIEVIEEIASFDSNVGHCVVASADELGGFLGRIGFPDHGVIVRPAGVVRPGTIQKDIDDADGLRQAFDRAARAAPDGHVHVETDMRAHRNPSRMRVLQTIAERLALRLATACPRCSSPGFGQVDAIPGLPCAWCEGPTDLIRSEVDGCPACPIRIERPRSDGLQRSDPAHCPSCNP